MLKILIGSRVQDGVKGIIQINLKWISSFRKAHWKSWQGKCLLLKCLLVGIKPNPVQKVGHANDAEEALGKREL